MVKSVVKSVVARRSTARGVAVDNQGLNLAQSKWVLPRITDQSQTNIYNIHLSQEEEHKKEVHFEII